MRDLWGVLYDPHLVADQYIASLRRGKLSSLDYSHIFPLLQKVELKVNFRQSNMLLYELQESQELNRLKAAGISTKLLQ